MYPPIPHPASWMAVTRQVALNRIYVYCMTQDCDKSIWVQIEKQWPELFLHMPMAAFLHTCSVLLSAVDEYCPDKTDKGGRHHFFENLRVYLKTHAEVKSMGFEESDATICNIIAIFRSNTQLVLNSLLTLHAE